MCNSRGLRVNGKPACHVDATGKITRRIEIKSHFVAIINQLLFIKNLIVVFDPLDARVGRNNLARPELNGDAGTGIKRWRNERRDLFVYYVPCHANKPRWAASTGDEVKSIGSWLVFNSRVEAGLEEQPPAMIIKSAISVKKTFLVPMRIFLSSKSYSALGAFQESCEIRRLVHDTLRMRGVDDAR